MRGYVFLEQKKAAATALTRVAADSSRDGRYRFVLPPLLFLSHGLLGQAVQERYYWLTILPARSVGLFERFPVHRDKNWLFLFGHLESTASVITKLILSIICFRVNSLIR